MLLLDLGGKCLFVPMKHMGCLKAVGGVLIIREGVEKKIFN